MASYALAAFTLAALLALTILALSDANERSRIAPIGLTVSALFWTVPPVALTAIGASATKIMLIIALSTLGFWALLAGHQLRQAFA
ncbi:hypothetical protein [Corynebacterium rhinophilum]|uniref:hypothetical protein n=1 Tax=Corynebacterium rhinophilum TaxID=3050197 RepID=UPI0013C54D7C|nr:MULTISPECIES: hypothetical protein [unclassified Corynebacterium]MDK8648331.1 hypothetical protein [Corynebacterium sp. MSK082]MDK8702988.1 hypothetical protein [Corynebacterium sp. MSK107]CAB0884387.1 hypothetical protein FRC0402_01859 [Corynebacterium diphtheriae]